MTLVVIGPVTEDLIIIGKESSRKTGGATYFQSFVFEEFYNDYIAVVNCADENVAGEFPDSDKVKVIKKDDTHYFINRYPFKDNMDVRHQLSNFADIPILESDLKPILEGVEVEGFVLNPLNRNDFPVETVKYLKSFNVPVFFSIQGFLRIPDVKADENYTIKLEYFDRLDDILCGVDAIFLDEGEANMIGHVFDVDEMIITDGSNGSRVISDEEIIIDAVPCGNVVDTTGCGDTYMAAYISQKMSHKSSENAGNFASLISSRKIEMNGPYMRDK